MELELDSYLGWLLIDEYTLQEYLQICRKYLISVVMVTVDDIIVGKEE